MKLIWGQGIISASEKGMCLDLIQSRPHEGISLKDQSYQIFKLVGERCEAELGSHFRRGEHIGDFLYFLIGLLDFRGFERWPTDHQSIEDDPKGPDVC